MIYRIKSVNEHGVHSPFVYELLLSTIYNKKNFYSYIQIEKLRKSLWLSDAKIECIDLGAGFRVKNTTKRSVQQLVSSSAKPSKYAQLLFRLVNYFQPTTILELGTSLGISSAYMASANSRSKVITIEGCKEIADVACRN